MNNLTIMDIAREAGVSKATVSRVLNGTGAVRAETRMRVERVIEKHGFTPSLTAQNLSRGRSSAVGFVVPAIDNPFFGQVLRGAMEIADRDGMTLIFYNTDDDREKEEKALRLLMDNHVCGVLYTPAVDHSEPEDRKRLMGLLRQLDAPVVVMDRDIGLEEYDVVRFDDRRGVFEATEALLAAGHERIGLINATLDRVLARERQGGYEDAFRAWGKELPVQYIRMGDFGSDRAYALSRELLAEEDRPSAVICCNNRTTVGFLRALYERGERLPDDMTVIGLDRIEVLDTIHSPLNFIERDAMQMGREAALLLKQRLEHPGEKRAEHVLDTKLVLRHAL